MTSEQGRGDEAEWEVIWKFAKFGGRHHGLTRMCEDWGPSTARVCGRLVLARVAMFAQERERKKTNRASAERSATCSPAAQLKVKVSAVLRLAAKNGREPSKAVSVARAVCR